MKKLLLILLCFPFIGFGQNWEKNFGGSGDDFGNFVQQTTDGGYIITGETYSYGNGNGYSDVYLMKIDGNGVEQWSQTFGGIIDDWGMSIQQTTDGGYIITGYTRSFGNGGDDVYLIKTDDNGVEQWSQTFGGTGDDYCSSVQQTNDGGYIITGETYSIVNGSYDVYLIKTDGNGIEQWNQTFGGASYDWGNSVQQTNDGGYIIAGETYSYGNGDYDVYLIKTDGYGVEQWNQTFGGANNDAAKFVQQTTDGGYIITGETYSYGNGNGYSDVYLIKTDGNGVELWSQTFGGTDYDWGNSIQQTTDGGYIITGGTTNSIVNGYSDVYLLKTDVNGVEQWSQTFGGTDDDEGKSVQQTTDGGYIISGKTRSFGNGNSNVYLIKTDGNGNVTSTFNIPTHNTNRKLEKTVDLLGKETKPKTNTPFIDIYDDGTVEKRIVIE